ncbi:MAG TPA: hypothetical protein VL947_01100, partial [Cytophagales bacterium]|nr:hypothetical protein [Cytophagales bacterium]
MNKSIPKTCLLLLVILSACKLKNAPDHLGLRTNPGLAAPLVDVNLKLSDVVNTQAKIAELSLREDNVYVITYKDTVFSDTISKYVKLNDQVFSESYSLEAAELLQYNTNDKVEISNSYNREETFSVEKEDQRFTKIDLKSGLVTLE